MSAEILGVSLSRLEDPIRVALRTYEFTSGSGLRFDVEKASRLELTPDKPNSARSVTDLRYWEADLVDKLYVIAFKPGDGTGSEVDHKLDDIETNPYPRKTLVVPRNKRNSHSEVLLTLVSHKTEDVHAEPDLFAGTYELLGLDGNRVKRIGTLGHKQQQTQRPLAPVATYTVGYVPQLHGKDKRFGDPHAVYSDIENSIQVCAFISFYNELNARILRLLNPQFPLEV